MKKSTFTILLITLLCVSIAGGYFGYKFLYEGGSGSGEYYAGGGSSGDGGSIQPSGNGATTTTAPAVPVAQEQPAAVESDAPRITWVDEPKRLAREVAEGIVEYRFQATARTRNNSPVEYKMTSKDTGREYTNRNGQFKIEPTDSGEYTLIAKNTVTGELSNPKVIKGFKKVAKISASELQRILNDISTPDNNRMIYASFVKQSDLKIVVNGLGAGEIPPASLSAIWAAVTAQGWQVAVLGTPEYDKYNRIKKFTINIEQ